MSFKFPTSLYTPDELQFCIDELRSYAASLAKLQRQKGGAPKPELSDNSKDLLGSIPVAKRQDAASLDTLCTLLEGLMDKVPVVHITLAAPATHTIKNELVTWLRSNISAGVLATFHVNPDIAGGMMVRTTNHIFDFSWRSLLLKEPGRIVKAIANV